MEQVCLFCGGDSSEPNHRQRCDGRQGDIEASIDMTVAPVIAPPAPPRVGRNTQETSIEAYYDLLQNGHLGEWQVRVLIEVIRHPDSTANELFQAMTHSPLHTVQANLHARLNELRDEKGVVVNSGKRLCTVSGRRCLTWKAEIRPCANRD